MLAAAKSNLSTSMQKTELSISNSIQIRVYTSTAKSSQEKQLDRFLRDQKARELLSLKVDPNIENIKDALKGDIKEGVLTEEVLELCDKLFKEGQVLHMPISNSSHVSKFSEVAGPEHANSAVKKPGCFHLHSPDSSDSYVGQSTTLGKQVKSHANGKQDTTRAMINSFGLNGYVTLYIVDPNMLPNYINMHDFLLIFKQYLFFKLQPTVNKVITASVGVLHSPNSIAAHIAKVAKPLFVYLFLNGEYTLLYTFSSISALGHLMEYGRKWPARILGRGGFYRYALYLSEVPVDNSKSRVITKEQLVAFIQWLTLQEEIAKGDAVAVTNIKNGTTMYYPNFAAAAEGISCNRASIKPNRSTPLKGKYYFSLITTSDYINAVMPDFFEWK